MANIVELAVEIVKAQAAQRRMSAEEVEEYIRRTASALQGIVGTPASAGPSVEEKAGKPSEQAWLTVQQAAEALGRNVLTVYRYIQQGKLRAQRAGRSYRILPEDVQALRGTLRPRRMARGGRRVRRAPARRRRAGKR